MEKIIKKAAKSHLRQSQAVPLLGEEGGEVAGVAKGDKVKVEIERLDRIEVVELEARENIGGGGVVEAARVRGGLAEGWQWGCRGTRATTGRIL